MNSNYKSQFSNLSGNYYDITTNYIKDNPDDKAHLWSILLSYLHSKNGLTDNEIQYSSNDTRLFHYINYFCDFESTAFENLITSLVSDLKTYDYYAQNNPHWNESWNDALINFIEGINPSTAKEYENSHEIYINEDGGIIAPELIRGGITTSAVPFRIKDMENADAGANFKKEIYEDNSYAFFYQWATLTITQKSIENNLQSIRTTHINLFEEYGVNPQFYCKVDKAAHDLLNKPLTNRTDINTVLNGISPFNNSIKRYKDEICPEINNSTFDTVTFTIESNYEPQKVYVLYYPWVIPWYNNTGQSYSFVRGADKIISALANEKSLQFTIDRETEPPILSKWIRLIMPENVRRVEVEDLNRDFWVIGQVMSAIGAYLFDPNGPLPKALKDMIQEITDIWGNIEYLWGAIAALGQKPYITEVKTMVVPLTVSELQPYLKYDNFNNLGANNSLADFRNACETRLNYLRNQYLNKHLVILPEIRINNYEKNYYSRVFYPGIMKLNRNETSLNPIPWRWDAFSGNTSYDIDLTDASIESHKSHTYGLRESGEETYNYYAPLSKKVSEEDGTRYYELLRPSYNLTGTYNNDTLSASASISYWDAAQQAIFNTSRKIWENGQWLNPSITETNIVTTGIERGYYQGELLSTYKKSESIDHLAKVIYVELEPENLQDNEVKEKDNIRIGDANNVLQYYFTKTFCEPQHYNPNYNPDQLYILIGHFFYRGITKEPGDTGLAYWTTSGMVSQEDSAYKAGSEGIDVGTVVYLPGKHDQPIVYNGDGAYWAYSLYKAGSDWDGSTGAASYRFEIYTKNGRITDDTSSWYLKMISIASVRKETNIVPTPQSHYFEHSAIPGYIYSNRRIFIYYLDGRGNIKEYKWERENLSDDFVPNVKGHISFEPSRYPFKSVQNLTGHASQMQILKINTKYSANKYPEYEGNYLNNGYNS